MCSLYLSCESTLPLIPALTACDCSFDASSRSHHRDFDEDNRQDDWTTMPATAKPSGPRPSGLDPKLVGVPLLPLGLSGSKFLIQALRIVDSASAHTEGL